MNEASLGDVPGNGYMEIFRSGTLKSSRGTFQFSAEHESDVWELFQSREPTEFVGEVREGDESSRMRIKTILTRMRVGSRVVHLTGSGAPYE